MSRLALPLLFFVAAGPAVAHPGAHVHPHDGAHWLVLVTALGVIALAAGLARAQARTKALK